MGTTEYVVQFENVSKRYANHPRTLRESLSRWRRGPRGRSGGADQPADGALWALKDVSFAVERGEVIGVIGANGAGKSTLLKLMAGITAPTAGRVHVQGRVASLIELGAGFNLDLTGRENVYLNGLVLGMRRREIQSCYDRIAEFSGLGRFLEVPVKYYSSGMYARLGFSIAAHVRGDVVLADEILGVGDAAFQQQCLQKIHDLKASATVVCVSHDLVMIEKVCTRALWFREGRLECDGVPQKVTDAYLETVRRAQKQDRMTQSPAESGSVERRIGSGEIEIVDVATCDGSGQERAVFRTFSPLIVRIRYRVNGPFSDPNFGVNIYAQDGAFVHGSNTFLEGAPVKVEGREGTMTVAYPRLPLLGGVYWLTVGVTSGSNWAAPYDLRERVARFEVLRTRPDGGLVRFDHQWGGHV